MGALDSNARGKNHKGEIKKIEEVVENLFRKSAATICDKSRQSSSTSCDDSIPSSAVDLTGEMPDGPQGTKYFQTTMDKSMASSHLVKAEIV